MSGRRQRWPSSWISTTSIFVSQGAPWCKSQTRSLAQWCHQTADHGPEREWERDSWHCSGCCAVWHSGLADLWGWGDSALALGLHEEKVLAVSPPSYLLHHKTVGHKMLDSHVSISHLQHYSLSCKVLSWLWWHNYHLGHRIRRFTSPAIASC